MKEVIKFLQENPVQYLCDHRPRRESQMPAVYVLP